MMKVKIFASSHIDVIEKRMNSWFNNNKEIIIIDKQQSMHEMYLVITVYYITEEVK